MRKVVNKVKKGGKKLSLLSSVYILRNRSFCILLKTPIILKRPGNTGISQDIRFEFTTHLLLFGLNLDTLYCLVKSPEPHYKLNIDRSGGVLFSLKKKGRCFFYALLSRSKGKMARCFRASPGAIEPGTGANT